MNYTKYHPTTGEILSTLVITDAASLQANLSDNNYLIGQYHNNTHYIDIASKTAIVKPVQPGIDYVWDIDNKSWQLDQTLASAAVRSQRNGLLSAVDRVNPVWYLALSAEQQTELSAYRQALLAVPQQSGFPESVTWPDKPTWL